jgi:hypothetical protein
MISVVDLTSLTFLAALQESKIFKAHFVAYLVLAASLFRATFAPLQHFERFETDSGINKTSKTCSNFHLKTPFNDLYDLIINLVINLFADQ